MKIEINKFNFELIEKYRYVFFYGNYSNFIEQFHHFFLENYRSELGEWNSTKNNKNSYRKKTMAANEFLKYNSQQEDLFSDCINVNVINNVNDTNFSDIFSKAYLDSSSIYFFVAGDYRQTKQVTTEALANKNIIALPVFKNKATISAILRKTILNLSKYECDYLSGICERSNENIFYLIEKIALLKAISNSSLDIETFTSETELFFLHMEPIPFARFLAASYLIDTNLNKFKSYLGLREEHKINNILEKMLNVEINVKLSKDIKTDDLLNPCFLAG